MNRAEKDFLYLAREILPWLKYLEKRRSRENFTKEKPIPKKKIPNKNKRGLEKFVQ